jgi:outer membrane immunogenic protein
MVRITIYIISFISLLSYSQNPLAKGQFDLNAGLGFSTWGIPFYIGADYGIHKDVTLGAEFSYRSHTHYWNGNKNYPGMYYRHSSTGLLFNGNYHFNSLLDIPKEWDFYAGANVGLFFISDNRPDYIDVRGDDYRYYGTSLGLGLQVGGRYFFTDRFGLNLEFGGGNVFSSGKFGVTFKF